MNLQTLQDAITEAERFIVKAQAAETDFRNNQYAWNGTVATGAARRASMDLTRALARMRKTG